MKLITINSKIPERKKIEDAGRIIRKGGIIIFPTDTVYGIGTGINNIDGIKEIYRIKRRERNKPLILFIQHKKYLKEFVKKVPIGARKIIKDFWPGAITLIFEASQKVPEFVRDKRGTIGIRIPKHPVVLALLNVSGIPLVTTSANISGEKSPQKIEDIPSKLLSRVDLVIDGGWVPRGRPSTVLDLTQKPFRVLRQGAITKEELEGGR